MSDSLKRILNRLRKPSVIMILASQVTALLILCGVRIDENLLVTAAASICAILSTLGLMSGKQNDDEEMIFCSTCAEFTPHVQVNGRSICKLCGTANRDPEAEALEALWLPEDDTDQA